MTDLADRLQTALGGAYTLERELGGGGMSRVFVATEAALGRKVVIKVLPPELAAAINVERFRREIQLVICRDALVFPDQSRRSLAARNLLPTWRAIRKPGRSGQGGRLLQPLCFVVEERRRTPPTTCGRGAPTASGPNG